MTTLEALRTEVEAMQNELNIARRQLHESEEVSRQAWAQAKRAQRAWAGLAQAVYELEELLSTVEAHDR